MNKIVEVTGLPGSGKSTYVRNEFQSSKIISGFCNSKFNSFARGWISIARLLQIYKLDLTKEQVNWLFEQASLYNETLFNRLNALRNSLLKFSFTPNTSSATVVIDEGISHIPFLFQLNKKAIEDFTSLFYSVLIKRKIHFLNPPSETELYNRIANRGHKRATTQQEITQLIKKNVKVYKNYKRTLLNSDLTVKFIDLN